MPECLSHNWVGSTRKAHQCVGCAATFPAGTRMLYCVWIDGGLLTAYYCEACDATLAELRRVDPHYWEDGHSLGEVGDVRRQAAEADAKRSVMNGR